MTTKALEESEIQERLDKLNQNLDQTWELESGKLHKTFTFKNFIEAFAYMSKVALYAEKINHHPEWFNVYKTLEVRLTTHEVDGLSDKDFDLATFMESSV